MNMTSIGDMAHYLMLRTRTSELKMSIDTLTQELSTGQTADVSKKLGADYSYLTDIDHNLSRLGGYGVAATEAALFAQATQLGLENMQNVTGSLGVDLLTITPTNLETVRLHTGHQARAALDTVMSSLNGAVGGRTLFSGVATDTSPMGSADTLLTALKAEVTGLTTNSQILQAIDDWFADPGGFSTVMYSGSDQPLAPIQVGSNEHVTVSLRADDPEFRDVMRNLAVAVLATDPDLALDSDAQNAMLHVAGLELTKSQTTLTSLRADLGFAEARIEEAGSRNAAARTSLEYARNELLGADPFDTAIRLQEAQFQLESLYAVTVRASRLSLLSFLK